MKQTSSAALPATCGELVQGTLDGIPCLVSCPIDCYSIAEIRLKSVTGWEVPHNTPKAITALRDGLEYLGGTLRGGLLKLVSELPPARGYGSSTADVGATLYALGEAAGQPIAPDQVAQLAIGVEPSDSTVFPGLALFGHRDGGLYKGLGPAPPLAVVVIDPGGEVDTLAFNRTDHGETLGRLACQHREAFGLLCEGVMRGDWEAVGKAATLSACTHQVILPNSLLEPVLALAEEVGALGVCRAHSGTLLGLLFDPRCTDLPAVATFVARRLPPSVSATPYRLVDGGPRYSASVNPPIGRNKTDIKLGIARI
jgi:L-threonine kinase